MRRKWLDGQGVAFAEQWDLLPRSVKDWPKAVVAKSPRVVAAFGRSRMWCACCACCGGLRLWAACGSLETHHIIGGSRGRSDEDTNLLRLCRECHEAIQGRLPVALWLKWKWDRESLSWVRLALLHRSFLPEPRPLNV